MACAMASAVTGSGWEWVGVGGGQVVGEAANSPSEHRVLLRGITGNAEPLDLPQCRRRPTRLSAYATGECASGAFRKP